MHYIRQNLKRAEITVTQRASISPRMDAPGPSKHGHGVGYGLLRSPSTPTSYNAVLGYPPPPPEKKEPGKFAESSIIQLRCAIRFIAIMLC